MDRTLADQNRSVATDIGLATLLLFKTVRRKAPIAALAAWLIVPVRLGQFRCVFDDAGNPRGYATWAFVSNRTLERLRTGQHTRLELEDWNDGDHLWIVDVVAPEGYLPLVVRDLRALLTRSHPVANFSRSKAGVHRFGKVRL